MIFCKELNKTFANEDDLHKAIIANKSQIVSLKKDAIKFTDGFECSFADVDTVKNIIIKGNEAILDNPTEIKVRIAGNTTRLLDGHRDVHIDGLWKRTLKSSDQKMHLQEHVRRFDAVISDKAKVYAKTMSWKDLGAPYEGETQVLLADSLVTSSRNAYMFEQYKNGWVNNHSVGMQYVDIKVCINSKEKWAEEEKANWDKYYPLIANKEDAENITYFYAVLEAKLVEISAVLFGSNFITPTLDNNLKSEQSLSEEDKNDSPQGTQSINNFYNPNLY